MFIIVMPLAARRGSSPVATMRHAPHPPSYQGSALPPPIQLAPTMSPVVGAPRQVPQHPVLPAERGTWVAAGEEGEQVLQQARSRQHRPLAQRARAEDVGAWMQPPGPLPASPHRASGSREPRPPAQAARSPTAMASPLSRPSGTDRLRAAEPVLLHIYDVTGDARVQLANELFRPVGTGAFHAGVEIHREEWSFGYRGGIGTGVFSCAPRSNAAHSYRETVQLGETRLSRIEVQEIVKGMEAEWLGKDYELFGRNCVHFCETFCDKLGVGKPPDWVAHLARTSAALIGGVKSAVEAAQNVPQNTAEAVRQIARRAASVSPEASESEHEDLSEAQVVNQCQFLGGLFDAKATPRDSMTNFMSVISQLWLGGKEEVETVDVVLELTFAKGRSLERLPCHERRFGRRLLPGQPWQIGPKSGKGNNGGGFIPELTTFPYDRLFDVVWEPPCLYVRKPAPEAELWVGGSPVKSMTCVLLHGIEIAVHDSRAAGRADAQDPLVTMKYLREARQRQASPLRQHSAR